MPGLKRMGNVLLRSTVGRFGDSSQVSLALRIRQQISQRFFQLLSPLPMSIGVHAVHPLDPKAKRKGLSINSRK